MKRLELLSRSGSFARTLRMTLLLMVVMGTFAFAGAALNLTEFFGEWGAIINTLLGIVSSFFAWFFVNLKKSLKESADVVNSMAVTVSEAVDVFDAFVNVIQIGEGGNVSIPADAFVKVQKELNELKVAASKVPIEVKEMTAAWGNLFRKPTAAKA